MAAWINMESIHYGIWNATEDADRDTMVAEWEEKISTKAAAIAEAHALKDHDATQFLKLRLLHDSSGVTEGIAHDCDKQVQEDQFSNSMGQTYSKPMLAKPSRTTARVKHLRLP